MPWRPLIALIAIATYFPVQNAAAQCNPTWGLEILPPTGLRGYITLINTSDLGAGPTLFATGAELSVNGINLDGIAAFDGVEWSPLGSGLYGTATAMLSFDEGSGPALYVGGSLYIFDLHSSWYLARWNGATWAGVPGLPGPVSALALHGDQNAAAVYAACVVSTSGRAVTQIVQWNGASWNPVGANLVASVSALQSFDDGHGPLLFAAGSWVADTGATFPIMYRWNGAAWIEQAGATEHPSDGTVRHAYFKTLQAFDDGSGPALYAAGYFSLTGIEPIRGVARWNGKDWFAVGTGIDGPVQSMLPIHDDQGPALYAGGSIRIPGSPISNYILRWDGNAWTSASPNPQGIPSSLATFNLGTEQVLCTGVTNGGGVVQFNSSTWQPLSSGHGGAYTNFSNDHVTALAAYDAGAGRALYVGGRFAFAGGIPIRAIARWDGSSFAPLGTGVEGVVFALAVFDDGTGPALYAAGNFPTAGGNPARNIARWNGSAWSAVGTGIGEADDAVASLEVFDDGTGPALYAGGLFDSAGGKKASNIAKWNGTDWSPVKGGVDGWVNCLRAVREKGVPVLYAGGNFYSADGKPAEGIARWNGSEWSGVGGGLRINDYGWAATILEYDDGSGPALYVGGYFDAAGGIPANSIARWDGLHWSPVGDGVQTFDIWSLAAFDDGSGRALYAGGDFVAAGASSASCIAKWDGRIWQPVGTGLYTDESGFEFRAVQTLLSFDDGNGPSLFVGGHFRAIDNHYFLNIARLVHSAPSSPSILHATGSLSVCAGDAATFSVLAMGKGSLGYQWRRGTASLTDGPNVAGAQTPTLTVRTLSPGSEIPYNCVVTDSACSVVSATAYLSVPPSPPIITRQPSPASVLLGSDVTLSIGVDYSPLNALAWRKNGSPLKESPYVHGVATGSLTLTGATFSDAGQYDVVITNACGSVTSNPARLTVLGTAQPPAKPIGPIPANPG